MYFTACLLFDDVSLKTNGEPRNRQSPGELGSDSPDEAARPTQPQARTGRARALSISRVPARLNERALPLHSCERTEQAKGAVMGNPADATPAPHPTLDALPAWPGRSIAFLATLDDAPHAIPVSAPVRAGDARILLSLKRTRNSLARLRRRPAVALTLLAPE